MKESPGINIIQVNFSNLPTAGTMYVQILQTKQKLNVTFPK